MRKILSRLSIAFAILALLIGAGLWFGAYHIAPYAIIQPARFKVSYFSQDSAFKNLTIPTRDSILLKTLVFPSHQANSRGTLLLLHGIAASKEQNFHSAESFSNAGFNVVIFDLRAHGESGGKYCTYGYFEKSDVSDIIDFLFKNNYADFTKPLGIIGISLGGAIALQAMASDKRIDCGIVESTFSSLEDVTYDYLVRITGIPFRWMSETALQEAGKIAKFPPHEVRPAHSAKNITQPILYIHGSADAHIPLWHGEKIFKNIASENKELLIIQNAHHNNVSIIGGNDYNQKRIDFLKKYMP